MRFAILFCAIFFLVAPATFGQRASADALSQSDIKRLLAQLHSDRFSDREMAHRRLVDMGPAVSPRLAVLRPSVDPEVRWRVDSILRALAIEQRAADRKRFEANVGRFVAGELTAQQLRLPSWERFRKIVGEDRVARQLFADMQLAEQSFLAEAAEQADPSTVLNQRVQALRMSLYNRNLAARKPLTLGSISAVVFVATQPKSQPSTNSAAYLSSFMYQPSIRTAMSDAGKGAALKRMLGAWISMEGSNTLDTYKLNIALRHDIKAGLACATRRLAADKAGGRTNLNAMLLVGKLGNAKQHAKLLQPYLKMKAVCHTYRTGKMTYETQVRDVALAVLIHMKGGNVKEFFPRVRTSQRTLFSTSMLGFDKGDTKKREAAFSKGQAWLAKKSSTARGEKQ